MMNTIKLPSNKIALVIGVNGQDGSFLAKHLHDKGFEVVGIGRQEVARCEINKYLKLYHKVDLSNGTELNRVLVGINPIVIYHTAAVNGPSGFKYENYWLQLHQVNVVSLHAVLEYVRLQSRNTKVVYFSSSKVFGDLNGKIIDEESPVISKCLYTATKNHGGNLINYYRDNHGVDASVIWLFNHESERRPDGYFLKRVVEAIKGGLHNSNNVLNIYSLDFWCDWGSADEYMNILASATNFLDKRDYILSTGNTVWARDVVEKLFKRYGLNPSDRILTEVNQTKQPSEKWKASNERLFLKTGLAPKISGYELFENIADKLIGRTS